MVMLLLLRRLALANKRLGLKSMAETRTEANFMVPFHSVSVVSVAAGWSDGNLSVHSSCVSPCYREHQI